MTIERPAKLSVALTGCALLGLLGCGESDATDGDPGDGPRPPTGGMDPVDPGEPSPSAGGNTATGGDGPDQPGDPSPPATPPQTCEQATDPYDLIATELDPSFVPAQAESTWDGDVARVPVTVSAAGDVLVGFNREASDGQSAVIVRSDATVGEEIVLADAALGGVTATTGGVAALLFDPNPETNERVWAAVARVDGAGQVIFRTDLFRSSNLDDVDTKGGAGAGRIGYVASSDSLVAYFGHTQRYDDGVRHQGGYLATVDAAGTQDLVSGWFGSHNLSQRLLVDGARIAVLGLGDAFPKGIFFNFVEGDRLRPHVVYTLAADGVGSANGKLGGMVDLGDQIAVPFITNRSISQDLDAGAWPDTDETISQQIRDAAAAGTDVGLLRAPKETPDGELEPVWIDVAPTAGTRLNLLRSVPYGPELILLLWAEQTGERRSTTSQFFSTVVTRDGEICQPKTAIPEGYGYAEGDDPAVTPDGSVVWANADAGTIRLVRLVP